MNLGIDLVNFKRKEFKNIKFAQRFCTHNEFEFYLKRPNKISQRKYLASLWAIKEAIIKATNKHVKIHDIDVQKTENGSKVFHMDYEFIISLSYQDKYVVAVVIANKKEG